MTLKTTKWLVKEKCTVFTECQKKFYLQGGVFDDVASQVTERTINTAPCVMSCHNSTDGQKATVEPVVTPNLNLLLCV